ncbi:hypothetical protein EYD10_11729 [Varanus komodoensis]|nr:hypothetical protein EYD10_11729 [Varanus komodoensis]
MGLDWSSPEEREPLLPPPSPAVPQQYPQHGQSRRAPGPSRMAPRGRGLSPVGNPGRLSPTPGRVYGRRWLVLLLFSLLGFVQGLVWNTWGPIQNSARQALAFSSLDIALLVFWGPIGFVPCFAFMWLMDKKGLRITVLLTSFLMVVGAGLRCVPVSDQETRKWLKEKHLVLKVIESKLETSPQSLSFSKASGSSFRVAFPAVEQGRGDSKAPCSFLPTCCVKDWVLHLLPLPS